MSEIVAHTPDPSCYLLFSEPGIEESQWVGPDPFLPRARRGGEVRRNAEVTRCAHPKYISKNVEISSVRLCKLGIARRIL
jgi:hypothetical protein